MDATQTRADGAVQIARSAGRPTLLVATDGSDASLRAAETAVGLAGLLGAKLRVLYVVDEDGIFRAGIRHGEAAREPAAFGDRTAGGFAALADRARVEHEGTVVMGGPARDILAVAENVDADYVALGASGTSRLGHVLFGSVAEEVLPRRPEGAPRRREAGTGRLETSGAGA